MDIDYTVIKKYRKKIGMTQKSLADKVGVTSAYIQQIENGVKKNPNIRIIIDIADVLGIDLKEVLNSDTLLFLSVHELAANKPLGKRFDYHTPGNFIKDIENYGDLKSAKRDLLCDLVKVILHLENIPPEVMTISTFAELELTITEYLKIKNKIFNKDF